MNRTKINKARIGRYGSKLLSYMKEHNQNLYMELLFSGCLEDWLAEQNEICKEKICEYAQRIANARGITEELKARDQMAWVGAMNTIRAQAEEIVIEQILS
ncbi:MAG: TnpV protein [Christensenellaceae bacterium]|nr:TnpV protein [Christensenellaceae bacterium]MCI5915078.1 TnpV protein [Christensenella sp.]